MAPAQCPACLHLDNKHHTLPVLPNVRLQASPVFQLGQAMGKLEADSLGMFSPDVAHQELALWEE